MFSSRFLSYFKSRTIIRKYQQKKYYSPSTSANLKIKSDDGIDALQLAKNLKNKEIIAIIERAYLK